MKKVYLFASVLMIGAAANAQQMKSSSMLSKDRSTELFTQKAPTSFQKAEGDVLYSSDFSVATAWTFTDNSVPAFLSPATNLVINSTTAPAGSFSAPMGIIASPTAANGFAKIDSDNGSNTEGVQDVKLTFNTTMDFTTKPNVTIEFYSYHRKFRDSIYLEFSTDGGTTWNLQQIEIDPLLNSTDLSVNPTFYSLNVSNLIGSTPNVRMRFRYIGQWDYAWMIDDMKIIESFDNDIQFNENFMATMLDDGAGGFAAGEEYYKVPTSQANFPEISFSAVSSNQGSVSQETRLSAVQNGAPAVEGTVATIPVYGSDSLVMTSGFALANGVNNFAVTTRQTSGADDNVTNNTKTYAVTKGGNEFARHDGVARKIFNYTDATNGLKVGNLMYFSDPLIIKEVKFRINNATTNIDQELSVSIDLFDGTAWTDDVYTGYKTVTASENGNYVTVDFISEAITIPADSYIRVWANAPASPTPVRLIGAQNTVPFTSYLVFSSDAATRFWTSETPMITIVEGYLGVEENGSQLNVSIAPNPTTESAKLAFDLTAASEVVVTVSDLAGNTVATQTTSGIVGKNTTTLNVATLAAGIYNVTISTGNAVSTKKLVIN